MKFLLQQKQALRRLFGADLIESYKKDARCQPNLAATIMGAIYLALSYNGALEKHYPVRRMFYGTFELEWS